MEKVTAEIDKGQYLELKNGNDRVIITPKMVNQLRWWQQWQYDTPQKNGGIKESFSIIAKAQHHILRPLLPEEVNDEDILDTLAYLAVLRSEIEKFAIPQNL